MAEHILLNQKKNYSILTLNRPEVLNALDASLLNDLIDALRQVGKDSSQRLLIITGAGEKSFAAGADIKALVQMKSREAEEYSRLGHQAMNAVNRPDLISIAAINGYALGGGLELALACDIRISSNTASFGLPEVGLGLVPGFGGTQRLPRLVGRGIALEMLLSGEPIDAARAERIGLVNRVVPQADLMAEAEKIAEGILKHKGPQAQKMARWLVHSCMDLPLAAGLEREITSFAELFSGEEPRIGMKAFVEKKNPEF